MRAIVSDAAAKGEHLAFPFGNVSISSFCGFDPSLDIRSRITLALFSEGEGGEDREVG